MLMKHARQVDKLASQVDETGLAGSWNWPKYKKTARKHKHSLDLLKFDPHSGRFNEKS